MTREEAIEILESDVEGYERHGGRGIIDEAMRFAITALRDRQTPAKLDRSRWEECGFCSRINPSYILNGILYCASCGRPLTEKAWAELERRIGGNDGTADLLEPRV